MSMIHICVLNKSNNIIKEMKIEKQKSFQNFLNQLEKKFSNIQENFEIYILDKNGKKIVINNEEMYKKIDDIIFIREINRLNLSQSLFEQNYNKLTESRQQQILDDMYNCTICYGWIENENPFLCYKCQKIFHEKCLKDWDSKCKAKNEELKCPYCKNELPIDKWNKKVNYKESMQDTVLFMNNINILNDYKKEQNKKINIYEYYIKGIFVLLKRILNQLNLIHNLIKNESNCKLEEFFKIISERIENLNLRLLSKVIDEEFKLIKNFIQNNINDKIENKINLNEEKISKKKQVIAKNNTNNNFNTFSDLYANKKKNNLNEINIISDESESDKIKNKINLKYSIKNKGNYTILGKQFVENNNDNIELFINDKPNKLVSNCELDKGENIISLIIKNKQTNLGYMFSGCTSLTDITQLKYLDVKNTKNFNHMFFGCKSLSNITSLQNWNTSNVEDFSYMFSGCSLLSDLTPLEHWNISNGINFSFMFSGCSSLSNINPLCNWIFSKANNFSRMFYKCSSIEDISGLKKWDVSKVNNFSYMFQGCTLLSDLKPLHKWKISNGNNFKGVFYDCSSLSDVKLMNYWKFSKEEKFKDMFYKNNISENISIKNWNN